jgi:hypothetical protein
MKENIKITNENLKELYKKVLDLKMVELFEEPYDPPEDLTDEK